MRYVRTNEAYDVSGSEEHVVCHATREMVCVRAKGAYEMSGQKGQIIC